MGDEWSQSEPGAGSVSLRFVGGTETGRKFGSGFKTNCDGMPACVTIVGGVDAGGRGTKVWRLLGAGRSRRKWEGGIVSSHSMDGSKKGKSPAK